jgi:3-methylcrotonyl-CoA carboxylase alpha subunit
VALSAFSRLLIANRGEIVVRVALSAREAGITPLGIFSEADRGAFFLRSVAESACVGPPEPRASYLNVANVLAAARELRADAVHPGYGFLSEQAEFARAAIDAGLVWIGPPPAAIEATGDKVRAKQLAREAGVPVVPGYDGDDQSPARLEAEARSIGTPVLIKASAGGGGRGMRVVRDFDRFGEELESARREALGAFGSDRVLLERYVERPRHIEFQILADAHGNVIHVGERECSIQRRHQKVLEEAPSPAMTPALRAVMGDAAIAVARAAGYVNAGTVEFLLAEDGSFYFLEMNARLQVEHPVTEAVYGLDLVRKQFAIAAGEPIDLDQAALVPRGWAVEARLNAEDPQSGYLPATGTIVRWEPPAALRLDSGVGEGSIVSPYYDSMIAKLIAWGPDRASAVERLTLGLEHFVVRGVPTNLPLLIRIARNVTYRAGYTTTAFLTEHGNFLRPDPAGEPEEAFVLAAGALLGDPRTWRVGSVGVPIVLQAATNRFAVYAARVDGDRWRFEGDVRGTVAFERDGARIRATVDDGTCAGEASVGDREVEVYLDGQRYRFAVGEVPSLEGAHHAHAAQEEGAISSPMPGKIVAVAVREGDAVEARDLLVVLEAMKMEHRIEAPHAGVIRHVLVAPGATVSGGATLVEIG